MQEELSTEYPELSIHLLSINLVGASSGVEQFDPTIHTLPMVNDNETDLIWEAWEGEWRDFFVLDQENRVVLKYNLTLHNLALPENYETLKMTLVETAGGTYNGAD